MNKYYQLLWNIVMSGKDQKNKKGNIRYLTNQVLDLNYIDLEILFEIHKVAKAKLRSELELYMNGIEEIETYNSVGITWWDYVKPRFINSYPQYFKKLPALIKKINEEKRPSKNYVLFIGDTEKETNQLPCLSLIQFQIDDGELIMTVYQRSADSNIGLPSDIYQMTLIAEKIDIPLKQIIFFIGNAHIYENNIEETKNLLKRKPYKFNLNV